MEKIETGSSARSTEKRFIDTKVGRIAYIERGEGPPALFVHGVFLNSHLWRHVIDGVCDLRRCIAIDLPSHGDSPAAPDRDVSFRGQAEALAALCDALELDRVDLVANDSGGGIAQIFAARHPERVGALTLTNCDVHDNYPPAAFKPTKDAAASGAFSARREEFLRDPSLFRPGFSLAYEDVGAVTDDTINTYVRPLFATPDATRNLERWLKATADCTPTVEIAAQLRRLEAPTLIVWGDSDVFFPLKWAYWLRGAIPGARDVVEVPGGKLFFPEERPQDLIAPLHAFWLN